jgi:hypothetical protein
VKGGHRIYELGGVSHLDQGTHAQFKPATEQLIARHHPAAKEAPVCTVEDTDVPMRDVAQAAMANIDQWVSTGKAPPHTSRMQVQPDGKDYVRDAFGNPLGGVRVAQLDVPLVTYAEAPASACGGVVPIRNLKRLPVDPALLAKPIPAARRSISPNSMRGWRNCRRRAGCWPRCAGRGHTSARLCRSGFR